MCQIPQNKFLIQKNQWISIFQTSNIQISKPYLEVSVIAFQENNSKLTNTYSSFASETYIPARLWELDFSISAKSKIHDSV